MYVDKPLLTVSWITLISRVNCVHLLRQYENINKYKPKEKQYDVYFIETREM